MRGLAGLDLTARELLPVEWPTPIEADAPLAARVPGVERHLFHQAIRADGSDDVLVSKREQFGRLDAHAVGVVTTARTRESSAEVPAEVFTPSSEDVDLGAVADVDTDR